MALLWGFHVVPRAFTIGISYIFKYGYSYPVSSLVKEYLHSIQKAAISDFHAYSVLVTVLVSPPKAE